MTTELPDGVVLQRTTDDFDAGSVPAGLLRAHRIAAGTWGRLQVRSGSLRFVWEDERDETGGSELSAGESVVIPPQVPHRVELGPGACFAVEFYR